MTEQSQSQSQSDRKTVRVDLNTLQVYPATGSGKYGRIGIVTEYVTNDGSRTPSGGKFESHRITVKLIGDDTRWVGQISNEELAKTGRKTVKLRTVSSGLRPDLLIVDDIAPTP